MSSAKDETMESALIVSTTLFTIAIITEIVYRIIDIQSYIPGETLPNLISLTIHFVSLGLILISFFIPLGFTIGGRGSDEQRQSAAEAIRSRRPWITIIFFLFVPWWLMQMIRQGPLKDGSMFFVILTLGLFGILCYFYFGFVNYTHQFAIDVVRQSDIRVEPSSIFKYSAYAIFIVLSIFVICIFCHGILVNFLTDILPLFNPFQVLDSWVGGLYKRMFGHRTALNADAKMSEMRFMFGAVIALIAHFILQRQVIDRFIIATIPPSSI